MEERERLELQEKRENIKIRKNKFKIQINIYLSKKKVENILLISFFLFKLVFFLEIFPYLIISFT